MPNLGSWEFIIIVLVVVLIFGAKRLPDASRSLGRSLRIFKSEVKEMSNDDKKAEAQSEIAAKPAEAPKVVETKIVSPEAEEQNK